MRYVNNWLTQLTAGFSPGAAVLPLSGAALSQLPPGEYALTLTNSSNPAEQNAWEIVRVTVAGGVASVTLRGQEGTIEQDWLAGALVYCAVTAATLNQLSTDTASVGQRMTDLETALPLVLGQLAGALDALELRIEALEGGTPPDPGGGDGLLTDDADNILTDDQNQPLIPGTV